MKNYEPTLLTSLHTGHDQERFDIFAEIDSLSDFDWFVHYVSIYFHYDNQRILVRRYIIGVELEHILQELKSVSSGQRQIPQECKETDLGILWNKHWQSVALSQLKKQQLFTWDWLGSNLLFLQCYSNKNLSNNTFLYQDEYGNNVLQISSCYPYFFVDDNATITYDQWLPSYKILYKKTIDMRVIEKWSIQLQELCLHARKHYHSHSKV